QPGDDVFDEKGRATTVVAVSEVWTDRDCYEMTFSDGSTVVADAEHLWVTETHSTRQRRMIERLRPPKRRAIGTDAEKAIVAKVLQSAPVGQRTTIRQAAEQLGWDADGPWHRLYQWTGGLEPASKGNRGRTYDTIELFQLLGHHLGRTLRDQWDLVANANPVTT